MNLILKLLSSNFLKSKIFKNSIKTILLFTSLYYLSNKYHFDVIKSLKSTIKAQAETILIQDTNITTLSSLLKKEKENTKNLVAKTKQECVKNNLSNSLKEIENDFKKDINSSSTIGKHTLDI